MQKLLLPLSVISLLLASLLLPPTARLQQRGLTIGAGSTQARAGKYYALIIGNNAYTSLPKLKTAEADASEIERLLHESYDFQTKLLLNATRSQIIAALSTYRRELTPDSNLLIYYAGHGYNDRDVDKAYWLPVDAARDDWTNWIIADEITTSIRVIPAKHILVISDSCYSGTLTRSGIREELSGSLEREQFLQHMAEGHSRTLMASGGNEPVADSGGGDHSVFAAALLRGLREMDKAQFTGEELFNNYVVEAVAGRAGQTPEYNKLNAGGHEKGDFVFVRIKISSNNMEMAVNAPTPIQDAPLNSATVESIKGAIWIERISTEPNFYEFLPDGKIKHSHGYEGSWFVLPNEHWYQAGNIIHVSYKDERSNGLFSTECEATVKDDRIEGKCKWIKSDSEWPWILVKKTP